MAFTLAESIGLIHADLSVEALQSNENLSNRGVQLFGAGFIVTPDEATVLLPLPLAEGYIATVETAKHRTFQFLDAASFPTTS